MQTYELTYIISSQMTAEEADNAKKDVEAFVQSKQGTIIQSQKSAPQVLAYPIKKQSSGFFVTTQLQVEESTVKEIVAEVTKNPKILRHALMVKKPVKIMKERRTRKPVVISGILGEAKQGTGLHPVKKMNPEDLDKKLDELLT